MSPEHYQIYIFSTAMSKLRVVRAFKSILEDLEEKRSTHSIHCLRTSRSHPVMSQVNRQSSDQIAGAESVDNEKNKPPTTGGSRQDLNTSRNNMIMLV